MKKIDEFFEMFFTIEPDAVEYILSPLSGREEYIQFD
jgi:hypothetical protein